MTNDLISREALKEYLEHNSFKYPNDEEFGCGFNECLLQVFMAIDNAPTVEPTFKPIAEVKFDKEQLQEIVDKAKAEVLASVERPKGKWVKSKDGYTRCDQCGSRGSAIKSRFCHHCGADMRKKESSNG